MNLKALLTLTLAAAGFATAALAADTATAAAPAAPPKPAILLDTWGGVPDLDYMKRLQAAGFEVDAIGHHELTWERLTNYNVLVLIDFPQEGKVTHNPHGGPASGPNLDETLIASTRLFRFPTSLRGNCTPFSAAGGRPGSRGAIGMTWRGMSADGRRCI